MRVLFWKHNDSLFTKAIGWWTGSHYTHCELLFSDNRRCTVNYNAPVRFYEDPADFPWDPTKWDCLEVHGGIEAKVLRACEQEEGCLYDWLGITMSQMLPFGRQHKTKWFCSELCTWALSQGGFAVDGLVPHKTSPARLYAHLLSVGGCSILPPTSTTRPG